MKTPKVSIIIINYNGKELLEKCLESLYKIDYESHEIILVDNNSSDDTLKFVTKNYPSVIIIKLDSNKGFAEPNNIAAKIAKGDYLLFLNNDTVVTPNFISEMIKVPENDKTVGICQSLLLKPDGSIDSSGDFIDELGVAYNSKTKIDEIREISSARGASMLIHQKIFNELGGFDEKFFVSFEDVDLGWRSWIKGFRIVVVPKSIVHHIGSQTINKLDSQIAFHGFKNQISMKLTNFESSLVLQKILSFFVIYGLRELRIWFDYKIKGYTNLTATDYESTIAQKPSLKIIIKSIFWIIQHPSYIYAKHKQVNSTRVFSTRNLEKNNIIKKSDLM